jgi:hypothetical protein
MFNPHLRFKLYLRAKRIRRRGDPELAHLASLVGAGRRTIDVGANCGVYSYWLARCSRVVEAFEPNPDLAQRLAAAGFRLHWRQPILEVKLSPFKECQGET